MLLSIVKWFAGVAAAVVAGLVVFSLTREAPPTPPPAPLARVNVAYDQVGRAFAVLGNTMGRTDEWLWVRFSLSIENNCPSGRFQIDASDIALRYRTPETDTYSGWLRPATVELASQTNRFPATWLGPGERVDGDVYFRVPVAINDPYGPGKTPYIRLAAGDLPCTLLYQPR